MHGSEEGVSTKSEWDLPCAKHPNISDLQVNGFLDDLRERREERAKDEESR